MTPMRFLHTCMALGADNLREGLGRTAYLMVTLAIAAAAWLVLAAMAAPFVGGGGPAGSGVTIINGNQRSAPLPLRYARRIEAVTGARNVAWVTLQMPDCKSAPTVTVTMWAYGGPGAASVLAHDGVDASAIRAWDTDPMGALISDGTAAACGWRVGQGVSPPDTVGTKNIPLHISGMFHDSDLVAFAHFDYINRVDPLMGKDTVLKYLASGGSAHGDELLAARVVTEFAHDFPTVSATTNTTVQNAWARYGKVQQLIAFVMAAILLCTASVLVSVLAHAAAQRRARLALLQVLGFRRGTLFSALVLEALIIAVVGVLLGAGLGELTVYLMPAATRITFGGLVIPAWAWWWMPVWLALLTTAALAWPAALVSRVRPVDYRAI